PARGRLVTTGLEMPGLPELLATPVGREPEEEDARQRDFGLVVEHRYPPLDCGPPLVRTHDRPAEPDLDPILGRRHVRPVRADALLADVRRPQRMVAVDRVRGEEDGGRIGVPCLPGTS